MKDMIPEHISKRPLILVSWYSAEHASFLSEIGGDIKKRISCHFRFITPKVENEISLNPKGYQKTIGYIILWVFGAYELLRTLDQTKNVFKPETKIEIGKFKKKLAEIRMPLSKQQLRGNNKIFRNQGLHNFNTTTKDFTFVFDKTEFEFKNLFREYNDLIKSISIYSFENLHVSH